MDTRHLICSECKEPFPNFQDQIHKECSCCGKNYCCNFW